jgi:hypothetical protein
MLGQCTPVPAVPYIGRIHPWADDCLYVLGALNAKADYEGPDRPRNIKVSAAWDTPRHGYLCHLEK